MPVDQLYRYLRPSGLTAADRGWAAVLSTSGGVQDRTASEHPQLFSGFVDHSEQMAVALLLVARVARTRFYVPPSMTAAAIRFADPVVTSNGDCLRFESFSSCCGVHARLDILEDALGGGAGSTGTTNVDMNQPMRQALSGVRGLDPLHLTVGEDLTVTTMEGSVTEQRVPLPTRWMRGFGEVQPATAAMRPGWELSGVELRQFVRDLPASRGAASFVAVPSSAGARLSARSHPSGVPVGGPERLRLLEPLLRFAHGLRTYGAVGGDGPAPSAWELQLSGARLTITLSPNSARGFSGEGGVLEGLADDRAGLDGDDLEPLISGSGTIDLDDLVRRSGLAPDRVRTALTRLGATGRVGFDLAQSAWFLRELPLDTETLHALNPRLRRAHALVAAGAVQIHDGQALVEGSDGVRTVLTDTNPFRCTCPWYGKHPTDRGPCAHVLAVQIATARSAAPGGAS